jgi:lysophospholipase L1-like esterase
LLEAGRFCRFCALLLALWLPGAALAAPPTSVLLIGDSITVGRVGGPPGRPYRLLLADALGTDYALTHVACSGTSSRDWTISQGNALCPGSFSPPTLYQSRALPKLPADVVTVLLGTNDAQGAGEPSPVAREDYAAAMREIVGKLRADGASHVVLMTPPPIPSSDDPTVSELLAGYREEVLALCGASPGVVCGPDLFTLLDASDFFRNDVHPNIAGHRKIADALQATIETLPVPEPATGVLLSMGLACIALGRTPARHRKRRSVASAGRARAALR